LEKEQEKWAIFWCDLLSPIIYGEIEPEGTNQFLKQKAKEPVQYPDGRTRTPSISTLRRKLNRYKEAGFDNLARKKRVDIGKSRNTCIQVIQKAIELKKEQPRRSPQTINFFLKDKYGTTVPRSTLYRHLKQAGATRMKLGIVRNKVRKRWSRNHTHDLWVGDFEEGPYVLEQGDVVSTHLSGFIDCHSRYGVEARYYLRQNLDILIDSWIRALSIHGTPRELYVDNAKIYHSNGLKAACHRLNIRLLHRPPLDPAPGGLVERFFHTVQDQFEAEVRAGDILSLDQLNRAFSAWLNVSYHESKNAETGQTPEKRYHQGLTAIRQVDMGLVIESFMQTVFRTVNRTFSDVQLNKRFYRVDPKLRGDRIEVRFDPFASWDDIKLYSLKSEYLGIGVLHNRSTAPATPPPIRTKPKHSIIDLWVKKHQEDLNAQVGGIDYRKVLQQRTWPFYEFAKTVAQLMGRKAGLTGLSSAELETLKKVYNQSTDINRKMVKQAFEKAQKPTLPYIILELKQLIRKEEQHVS